MNDYTRYTRKELIQLLDLKNQRIESLNCTLKKAMSTITDLDKKLYERTYTCNKTIT